MSRLPHGHTAVNGLEPGYYWFSWELWSRWVYLDAMSGSFLRTMAYERTVALHPDPISPLPDPLCCGGFCCRRLAGAPGLCIPMDFAACRDCSIFVVRSSLC